MEEYFPSAGSQHLWTRATNAHDRWVYVLGNMSIGTALGKCLLNGMPQHLEFKPVSIQLDRLCGLVVRIPGYRSRGHGFDSRRYQIF
jgi:hypothetical protein